LIRVEIFSEKTRVHPASFRADSWVASSCRAVEQRAYPTRMGLPAGTSAAAKSTVGPGDHDLPGARSEGHRDVELLAQRGHEDEPGGVVAGGGLAAAGAAGAAGGGVALGAGMVLGGLGRRLGEVCYSG
jgi:hypothetical protein